MRDARKFCRPKITKNPKIGDVYIKLKCGETAPISAEEYNKVKEFFKLDSVVGSSPSIGGNLIVKSKLLGVLTVISPEDFDPDIFEVQEVIGEKVAGYEYVDLGLPSGTLWATMNVGASSETDYGNYYMYGMGSKTYDSTDTPYAGTEDPLAASADTVVQVWGGDWHMPTRAQMQELTANTTYQWVTDYKGSGINGGTFTATNGAVLFFPAAGGWVNGSQLSVGNNGLYWSSSPNGSDSAYGLYFRNDNKDVLHYNRKYGYSVRGVKNPSSEDNKPLAKIGDILVHNTILNIDSVLSFNDWINANDSWKITGLYGIETFEEEDAVNGDYVIMANGHTLIIKPEDYNKVSDNWEQVDTIYVPPVALDILYSDANGNLSYSSEVLPVSEGKTPIGLCIAGEEFFGTNEKARWMSLKYMNYTTPETGSLTAQNMYWGNYKTDLNMIPNIQTTHNGGNDYGYFTVDYYDSSSQANKIPSMFNENNKWNTSILGAVNQYSTTDIQGREKTDLILASATSQSTWMTDISITNESGVGYAPAACCCARYHTIGTEAGDWYLGASGEMCMIIVQKTAINAKLAQIAAVYASDSISSLANVTYWSSTEYSSNLTYYVNANSGYISYYNKSNNYNVVAMLQY